MVASGGPGSVAQPRCGKQCVAVLLRGASSPRRFVAPDPAERNRFPLDSHGAKDRPLVPLVAILRACSVTAVLSPKWRPASNALACCGTPAQPQGEVWPRRRRSASASKQWVNVLQDKALAVPIYQRSYSWTADEIDDFKTDLATAFAQTDSEYFLGTIVLSAEGTAARLTIVDGQQRLATTTMLLAAIREEYGRRGDAKRAEIIHGRFLAKADLDSGTDVPQIRLNSEDDHFFQDLVVTPSDPPPVPQRGSHKLIASAYESLQEFVGAAAANVGAEWDQRLRAWVKFVEDALLAIVVIVPTESDAFLIFETLNDRGADLTIADLLKNFLFGRAGSQLDQVRDRWVASLGALEMTAENATFVTFLRHYWSSKHGATRERELYKSIKARIVSEGQAVDFADELQKAARLYAALLNPEHEFWGNLGTGTKEALETLLRLDLEQIRPLLLAGMQHFTDGEVKKLIRAAVAWGVRGLIFGGIGGGTYERRYCEAAVKIRNGDIKSVDELFAQLSDLIPSDEEFASAFGVARVPRGTLARYYLYALDRGKNGQTEPELVPNQDEEKVNLEHVLPKNPTDGEWTDFSAEQKRDFLYRLGNMALLQKGPNGRIGNKPFTYKQPILAASALLWTQDAGGRAGWTTDIIAARQQDMASLAVAVWPRETT
jgi:hypothetical protein